MENKEFSDELITYVIDRCLDYSGRNATDFLALSLTHCLSVAVTSIKNSTKEEHWDQIINEFYMQLKDGIGLKKNETD